MYLNEKHIIKNFNELDEICFKCKNLYNRANYIIRQEFFNNKKYITHYTLTTLMRYDNEFKMMPTRISQNVLRILDANWKSFFHNIKDWKKNPQKYNGIPKIPNYLNKTGKFNAIFTNNAILKPKVNKKVNNGDSIGLSSLKLRIKTRIEYKDIVEVNVKPLKNKKYQINICYEKQEEKLKLDNKQYCSIDLGLNNLMTLTSNKPGIIPQVINGRPLKSINQFYNKQRSKYQSELPQKKGDTLNKTKKNVYYSLKIAKLDFKRKCKIDDYLYKSVNYLIKFCIENELNTIVLGYNKEWKQEINMGPKNNQNFVNVPFYRLQKMIEYKCKLNGINLILQEESYTSKASFLDNDFIPKYSDKFEGKFSGYRKHRGMYKSKKFGYINADVNGSYNILRKAFPKSFNYDNGIEGIIVYPKRIKSFK